MARRQPKVTIRANCIMVDEYDRRVARTLSMVGMDLRGYADTVMRDGGRWDQDSPLYKEARLTHQLLLSAAMMVERLAERTIRKGLPKRERTILLKLLQAEVAANVEAGKAAAASWQPEITARKPKPRSNKRAKKKR